ncbi:MAG: hypothetical protein ACI9YL_001274 [Luteibaculaceae bacterium]|jgi:hypothetical protein
MKHIFQVLSICCLIFFSSCEKEETPAPIVQECQNCALEPDTSHLDMVIDFGYGYSDDYISGTDGSTFVPPNSTLNWSLNGLPVGSGGLFRKYVHYTNSAGFYTISLCVKTATGYESCKSKMFEIKNGDIISDEFPKDTTEIKEPEVDFTYSYTYSADKKSVSIGMIDVSKPHTNGSVNQRWYLNGRYIGSGVSQVEVKTENGLYSIGLVLDVKGVDYGVSKEFEITGIQ